MPPTGSSLYSVGPAAGGGGIGLRWWESAYLCGFVPLELCCSLLHPALLAPRLPFLPLLATSVYCSLGVCYSCGLSFALWRQYSARGAADAAWSEN